jgi:hypothetical protein
MSDDAQLYSHLLYKQYVSFPKRQLDLKILSAAGVRTGPHRLANLTVFVGVLRRTTYGKPL